MVGGLCRERGEMGDKLLVMSIVITTAASIFGKDGGNIVNLCIASIPNIMCNTKVRRLVQSINRKTK